MGHPDGWGSNPTSQMRDPSTGSVQVVGHPIFRGSDDAEEEEDDDDGEDEGDAAAAIVAEAGAEAVSAEAEDEDEDEQKDEHEETPFRGMICAAGREGLNGWMREFELGEFGGFGDGVPVVGTGGWAGKEGCGLILLRFLRCELVGPGGPGRY